MRLDTAFERDLKRYPRLTRDEEKELLRRNAEGDREARDRLILCNMGLIRRVALQCASNDSDLDDLMQYGVIGFMHALEKFDISRNVRLSTYVLWWIRQTVMRNPAVNGLVYVPRNSERECAEPMRSAKHIHKALFTLLDKDSEGVDTAAQREMVRSMRNTFARLPARLRHVLRERYHNDLTFDEVSKRMGISRERVRQLVKKGLQQMKRNKRLESFAAV